MKNIFKISLLLIIAPFIVKAQEDTTGGKIGLYGAVGVNIMANTPASSAPYYKVGGRGYTSYMPAVFFGMSVPTDPVLKRLLFRVEVSAGFSKYTSTYMNKAYPYVEARASFNRMDLSLMPQVIYNFYNGDNFKFYGGFGVDVFKSFYSNVYYGADDPSQPFDAHNDYTFRTFDTRFLFKAGIQVHQHFELFYNYLTSSGTTNLGYFQLNNIDTQVGIIYLF
ncbi:MAG TPA: hypothetical protein VHA56_10820 [Mucilaginibacter sp.]|nr:hypothetical protein [Mucilaginibacter sp.]